MRPLALDGMVVSNLMLKMGEDGEEDEVSMRGRFCSSPSRRRSEAKRNRIRKFGKLPQPLPQNDKGKRGFTVLPWAVGFLLENEIPVEKVAGL